MDVPHEAAGEGTVEKTLYMLVYHTSRKHTRDTPYYLTFFYAENSTEARKKANKRKKNKCLFGAEDPLVLVPALEL